MILSVAEASGSSDIEKALIGAAAVLTGGLFTILSNWFLESRKFRREQDRRDEERSARVRLAVRLLLEELAESERLIRHAAQDGTFWPASRKLPANTWNEYRSVIAQHEDSSLEWRVITTAFDSVNQVNWLAGAVHSETITNRPKVKDAGELKSHWESIRAGMRSLEHMISVQGPASRMMVEDETLWNTR